MLILSRKKGERILIGDDIEICIVQVGSENVRVGIEAPRDVIISREELRKENGGNESANA